MRVCGFDGCPEQVERGYCPAHHPKRTEARRSPSSRVTGTRRWRERTKPSVLKPGARCHYCGAPATTVDHRVPVSKRGASHDRANLVPACFDCNASKGGR